MQGQYASSYSNRTNCVTAQKWIKMCCKCFTGRSYRTASAKVLIRDIMTGTSNTQAMACAQEWRQCFHASKKHRYCYVGILTMKATMPAWHTSSTARLHSGLPSPSKKARQNNYSTATADFTLYSIHTTEPRCQKLVCQVDRLDSLENSSLRLKVGKCSRNMQCRQAVMPCNVISKMKNSCHKNCYRNQTSYQCALT